jgi:hypothetical protein
MRIQEKTHRLALAAVYLKDLMAEGRARPGPRRSFIDFRAFKGFASFPALAFRLAS